MEYTELNAHDVPPGVVTTWTAHAPTDAWRPDHRGISPGHEEHLAAGGSGSWIGSRLRMPYAFDAETLQRTLVAWIARHEVLRTTVVPDPEGGWLRETLARDVVAIEPTEVGWLGEGHAARFVAQHFETMSPLAWPHCTFATVVDPDQEGFFLGFGADHSVMDAYSQLLWFDEIVSLYERAAAGATAEELAEVEVGSHVDSSHDDRTLALALDTDSAPVARWREFLSDGAGLSDGDRAGDDDRLLFPRFPVAGIEAADHSLPQTSLSEWLSDADQAKALNSLCRALGTTAQSGILAALSAAMCERFGEERLRYILPMHTRYDAKDVSAVGWYVGLCPVDIDITGLDTIPELVSRVHTAVSAAKDLVRAPYPRIGELLGVQDTPHFAVSYVDARYIPGAPQWKEWEARALRSPAYSGDEVYFWFGRTHEGFNVAARYPATLEAERAVRGLVGTISAYIERVTEPSAATEIAAQLEAVRSLEPTA